MKNKKQKPAYLRIRFPKIGKSGGAHEPEKGGKYRRRKQKQKTRKELLSELE